MATTSKGTPYVEAADLVSGYPTVSLNLAEHIDDNVAYNAATINAQTGTTYTFALADATEGKVVTATNAASQTYTVPPESSVTWPAGSILRILNQGAGTVTVAAGSGVTINGTPLTLAQYKGAAIQKTGTDTWTFIPFSGGVGSAAISDTPTGSYTGYQYWTFTASGTLTVTTAGFADVLVVGGGAAGGAANGGGGGAGGHLEISSAYLPAGSLTVSVAAGGAGHSGASTNAGYPGGSGGISRLGSYFSPGGGGGGAYSRNSSGTIVWGFDGGSGGSGGGGTGNNVAVGNGGVGFTDLGNNGGSGTSSNGCGGGGGAGGVGANGSTTNGGNGGAGLASSITGTSVTRAGGGGGAGTGTPGSGGTGGGGAGSNTSAATNGTANSGGGGGGSISGAAGAGGSGIVIIRVAV